MWKGCYCPVPRSRTLKPSIMPRLQVLGDVAVHHPVAGVRHVDEVLDRRSDRHDGGVLPDEVLVGHVIDGQDQEALAVDVHRMIHSGE